MSIDKQVPETDEYWDKFTEAIKPTLDVAIEQQEKLKSIIEAAHFPEVGPASSVPKWMTDLPCPEPPLVSLAKRVDEISQQYYSAFHLEEGLSHFLDIWSAESKRISENLAAIFDTVSVEAAKFVRRNTDAAILWGKFGWTFSPELNFPVYYKSPATKEEADKLLSIACKRKNTSHVFDELLESNYHITDDMLMVQALFNQRRYKACALLLFSMIDAVIIHTQDYDGDYSQNRKQGGKEGIKRFEKLLENGVRDASYKSVVFAGCNEALKHFFSDGPNFSNSDVVLNRHLLCHGMLTRAVTKVDCVQLLLLYDNMLYITGNLPLKRPSETVSYQL